MANPIIKIKRGAVAPTTTLQAGEFAIDQVAKNLYLGVEVGGVTTNEIVGGNGTFATHTDVATAVTNATGSLGTMSTQNANAVAITGGTIDGVDITNGTVNYADMQGVTINSASSIVDSTIDNTPIGATTPSTGAFTSVATPELTSPTGLIEAGLVVIQNTSLTNAVLEGSVIRAASEIDDSPIGSTTPSTGAFTTLTASSAPSASTDVVRKTDLDSAISALGSVFSYKGDLSAHMSVGTGPFELDNTDIDLTTGAYYRVDVAGTYNAQFGGADPSTPAPAVSFDLKVGDAIVKTSTGWQKLDNVDAVVSGTANEIVVTGDENAGYTVSIDPVFSGRVTTAESDITDLQTKTQNITATAGETDVAGILTSQELWVGPSSSDAVKLLNPVAGPASIEAPSGKQLVIKNGAGNTAITVVDSGSGRVEFAYDVNVAQILDTNVLNANSASLNSMGVNGSANFAGGINVNIGNLVGNGTNEITDFIIDGGVY